jgi:16S rRNA (adenine1518-N6/adenine1519-N6)-dimethyltransferase
MNLLDRRLIDASATRAILRKYGLRPKKGLGQNFLINHQVLEMIMESAALSREDIAIEIGPGIGTLTQALAESAGKVVAVEIDLQMVQILTHTMLSYENVSVIHDDFLKVSLTDLLIDGCQFRQRCIVANLPYYITTPIILKLVEEKSSWDHAVIMMQKEVAQRINAAPGGKEYGSLSVAVQYALQTELIGFVPPSSFIPAPKVDSAVLKLTPRQSPRVQVNDESLFFSVVKDSFQQRRKTLFNNLKISPRLADLDGETLRRLLLSLGIDPHRRGETISIEEFGQIANAINIHRKE